MLPLLTRTQSSSIPLLLSLLISLLLSLSFSFSFSFSSHLLCMCWLVIKSGEELGSSTHRTKTLRFVKIPIPKGLVFFVTFEAPSGVCPFFCISCVFCWGVLSDSSSNNLVWNCTSRTLSPCKRFIVLSFPLLNLVRESSGGTFVLTGEEIVP